MAFRDPVVIKLVAENGIVKWTLLGPLSEINAYLDTPLKLGVYSFTPFTFYADAALLGLDPAECLAYKAAELDYYRLDKDADAPFTLDWWSAYQTARADKANLWLKIQKIVLANFRTYVKLLIAPLAPVQII